ncbi:porin [Onishia niordana]|uniref:porin n=1 Tax=Onishia niordana TaxID=2508711 RepID=UPI0010A051A7|nr:porin [Halomonas niordiana]
MTRRLYARLVLSLLTGVCSGGVVAATEGDTPSLRINGFGTLGVAHSSEDEADYVVDPFQPDGPGYSRSWSADVDSLAGLQVSADFTPKLSGVVQLLAKQRYDNSHDVSAEWANLKYQFTPDFSVRVGRIVQATFLYADTRNVAFTYPWVRPPTELYSLVPVTHNDGVDAQYRMQFGGIVQKLSVAYGSVEQGLPDRLGGSETKAEDIFSATSTTEYGATTLRISYLRPHLTIGAVNPLFDGFRQFGPEGDAIANRYDPDGGHAEVVSIGASYDPGQWFITGEWGSIDYNSVFGKNDAWYLSSGYRFGALTPYVTYARMNHHGATSDPGLTLSSLPPSQAGAGAGLNAALNDILGNGPEQRTITLGLRWDFMPNVAFKAQYEFIDRDDGSPGTFGNLQPDFEPGGDVDLFSASINFVF